MYASCSRCDVITTVGTPIVRALYHGNNYVIITVGTPIVRALYHGNNYVIITVGASVVPSYYNNCTRVVPLNNNNCRHTEKTSVPFPFKLNGI